MSTRWVHSKQKKRQEGDGADQPNEPGLVVPKKCSNMWQQNVTSDYMYDTQAGNGSDDGPENGNVDFPETRILKVHRHFRFLVHVISTGNFW